MTKSIFAGFTSQKPKANLLPAGEHVVEIVRLEDIDSFTNLDGTKKIQELPYIDACPQLAVMFRGEHGVITNRFNGMGYYKEDDFTPEEMEEKGLTVGGQYALTEITDPDTGEVQYTRIQHEGRSEDCANIFNQFFAGLGLPEGSGMDAVQPGMKLVIRVEDGEYQGRVQKNVVAYRKFVEGETVVSNAESSAATLQL